MECVCVCTWGESELEVEKVDIKSWCSFACAFICWLVGFFLRVSQFLF